MEYKLKNGESVIIRKPVVEDAKAIINIISVADTETKFLARNSGEFCTTEEEEKSLINNILNDESTDWFVAEYKGKVIGDCSVGLKSKYERYCHRAEVSFVILKDYCGMGIGGRFMQECIKWCKDKNVTQIELGVIADNIRAINMYRSFGFKVTGIIPKAMRYPNGTYADEKIMVLEL